MRRTGLLVVTAFTTFSWLGISIAEPCVDPRLLILFDASGSLGSKSNPSSNYNIAVNAVLSVTAANQSAVEFGLLVFPAPPDDLHCQTTSTLAVPFSKNNYPAFKAFFDGFAGPNANSDTPMLQVLKIVLDSKPGSGVGLLKDQSRPGYVVLVTDGSQDCCFDEYFGTGWGWDKELDCNWGVSWGDPNYWNTAEFEENRAELVTMVTNIRNLGIRVFVVGFGKKVDPTALDAMAIAGGTPRAQGCGVGTTVGPCYYQADNANELSAALGAVAAKVSEEVCNNLDDDCDGQTDEEVTRPCSTACGTGIEECSLGQWGPCSAKQPMPESCNGEDDDCDGITDNFYETCVTICGVGTRSCIAGKWGECSTAPKEEVCDGVDNDCDGVVDEGCECVTGAIEPCGESEGECEEGERECIDGKWGECEGAIGKTAEICDGKDNDCDGVTDGMTRPCYTACGVGREVCKMGQWVECDAPMPSEEICNGKDDDCDWQVDEELTRPCETACGTGIETCIQGVWAGCTAPLPMAEKCDGVDNDCDGLTDEDTDIPCQTDCGEGVRHCYDGIVGPCEVTKPVEEICDGLDNDCDGLVDDEATCPGQGVCMCGGCAFPPMDRDGTCTEGVYMNGYCVVDRCPPGKECVDGECVEPPSTQTGDEEGDAIGYEVTPVDLGTPGMQGAAGGCGCGQTLAPNGVDLGLLLALAIVSVLYIVRRQMY